MLDRAAEERRAVVTGNVPDLFRCHQHRVEHDQPHYGLLLFTNDTFPRHRHDVFVGRMLAALEDQLLTYTDDDGSSWVRWLSSSSSHSLRASPQP